MSGTPETFGSVWLGGASVEVAVAGGRIARIAPSPRRPERTMLPGLVDAHVHLDKTHTVGRIGRRPASLHEAIALHFEDMARWTAEDVRARASRGLAEAEAQGIVALRTHVDWTEAQAPLAWAVLGELAEAWRGRIRIDRAALAPLDLLAGEAGAAIADRVRADGATLGAFVYANEHLPAKLETAFGLALRRDLALDFHVDEGLDRSLVGLDTIVALTRRLGMAGRVLCGHCCALALRPEAEAAQVLEAAAEAGVALVALPTTNLYLQDARDGRTPRMIGLAPVQEARAAGVPVALALDNVRDAFYPYGDYDLLDAWRIGVLAAHLDPDDWIDAISAVPAAALGLAPPRIAEGEPADFVLIEAASPAEFVSHPRARREVWRNGRRLEPAAWEATRA
ncbi:amidohydrolase family protein [Amaricoccus sp.]|uniref:amidohydrolase family protein n=1 Tax=Amaricoccus sp. TaxID=1872485 RepID=UPI001B4E56CD|nr:amidohydrolase family protein [Amaricoccus sp.]MBP7000273.1 amidohydrolase family protein [Amaricoccus sp.]